MNALAAMPNPLDDQESRALRVSDFRGTPEWFTQVAEARFTAWFRSMRPLLAEVMDDSDRALIRWLVGQVENPGGFLDKDCPGCCQVTKAQTARDLGWGIDKVRGRYAKLERLGLILADWNAGGGQSWVRVLDLAKYVVMGDKAATAWPSLNAKWLRRMERERLRERIVQEKFRRDGTLAERTTTDRVKVTDRVVEEGLLRLPGGRAVDADGVSWDEPGLEP